MKTNPATIFLIASLGSLLGAAFASIDDPPKNKKKLKEDTTIIQPQQQRSINIEELDQLSNLFDSLIIKQDTLIKKKK